MAISPLGLLSPSESSYSLSAVDVDALEGTPNQDFAIIAVVNRLRTPLRIAEINPHHGTMFFQPPSNTIPGTRMGMHSVGLCGIRTDKGGFHGFSYGLKFEFDIGNGRLGDIELGISKSPGQTLISAALGNGVSLKDICHTADKANKGLSIPLKLDKQEFTSEFQIKFSGKTIGSAHYPLKTHYVLLHLASLNISLHP